METPHPIPDPTAGVATRYPYAVNPPPAIDRAADQPDLTRDRIPFGRPDPAPEGVRYTPAAAATSPAVPTYTATGKLVGASDKDSASAETAWRGGPVTIDGEAVRDEDERATGEAGSDDEQAGAEGADTAEDSEASPDANPSSAKGADGEPLTRTEAAQLEALKARDQEVRAHEQAHLSAAGGIAVSGASYSYQRGPDGNAYAIGGEVSIDTSAVAGDPAATLDKAEQIRRAAMAPAEPSSQDRKVAAQATQMAAQARVELAAQQQLASESGDRPVEGGESEESDTAASGSTPNGRANLERDTAAESAPPAVRTTYEAQALNRYQQMISSVSGDRATNDAINSAFQAYA